MIKHNDHFRKKIKEYCETGIIPTHKHHIIPKHHGGINSKLIQLNYKEHALYHLAIHEEEGPYQGCTTCYQSYITLMGLWNTFWKEVEQIDELNIEYTHEDKIDNNDWYKYELSHTIDSNKDILKN